MELNCTNNLLLHYVNQMRQNAKHFYISVLSVTVKMITNYVTERWKKQNKN